jgi:hypothetical protein
MLPVSSRGVLGLAMKVDAARLIGMAVRVGR